MRLAALLAGPLLGLAAHAAGVERGLPPYRPQAFEVPAAAARVVGYNDMREMLAPLARRFEAAHPGLRIELDLPGTRFAPAALASGNCVLAPMGALFTPAQLDAYRRSVGADPMFFRVAHASLDPKALSGPLAIFVHRDNPLVSLTLEQAARLFAGDVRTWGELGLPGEWSKRTVSIAGLKDAAPLALEFGAAAMHGRAFAARMRRFAQSVQVVREIAADRDAVGFAAAMRGSEGVRIVPVARRAGEPAVMPAEATLRAGRYPLDRYLVIYARAPLTPLVRDFLRLVLSREGQEAVAATPQRYIPLAAEEAAAERARLR